MAEGADRLIACQKNKGRQEAPLPASKAASVKIRSLTQNLRRDENEQLGLVVDIGRAFEKRADERNIAEERHLVGGLRPGGVENTAEHHGLAVIDQHLGDD